MSSESQSNFLTILLRRIQAETEDFEKRHSGAPFLPTRLVSGNGYWPGFKEYCVDLESCLGGAIAEYQRHASGPRRTVLHHAAWMYIPDVKAFGDTSSAWNWTDIEVDHSDHLEEFADTIRRLGDPERSLPRHGDTTTPWMEQANFAVAIAYVAGEAIGANGENFAIQTAFLTDDLAQRQAATAALASLIDGSVKEGFLSVHYMGLKVGPDMPSGLHEQIERTRIELKAGDHPILETTGRETLQALTLQFQRNWGAHEEELSKRYERLDEERNNLEGAVSHELCYSLYMAINSIDKIRLSSETTSLSDEGSMALEDAAENVRACFGAPWVLRHRSKPTPVWASMRPPTHEEMQAIFTTFDRKIDAAISSADLISSAVSLTRTFRLGREVFGAPSSVILNDPASFKRAPAVNSRTLGWPFTPETTAMAIEGKRTWLYTPHIELVRNALKAAKFWQETRSHGNRGAYIDVEITLDPTGRGISGKVTNSRSIEEGLSAAVRQMPEKLARMSYGLKAKVQDEDGATKISWSIAFDGENDGSKSEVLRR